MRRSGSGRSAGRRRTWRSGMDPCTTGSGMQRGGRSPHPEQLDRPRIPFPQHVVERLMLLLRQRGVGGEQLGGARARDLVQLLVAQRVGHLEHRLAVLALAEEVARQRGTRHETRWVLAGEFAQERTKLLAAMDQPSIDGVNTYFVARAAHAAGLKVAMSGLGGDELFAGYPSFRQIPRLVSAL
ncbi:MAG: hypothetical protein HYR75_07150, partial [Gemmatimonadetes bacterium]|nr:hypothetical protein [Gemmatimonadota bacterium]